MTPESILPGPLAFVMGVFSPVGDIAQWTRRSDKLEWKELGNGAKTLPDTASSGWRWYKADYGNPCLTWTTIEMVQGWPRSRVSHRL